MIQFAEIDPDGYPIRTGSARSLPEGAMPVKLSPERLVAMRLEGGLWIARPSLPAALVEPGRKGTVVAVSGLPAEAEVVVTDLETGDILTVESPVKGRVDLLLPDAGQYRVEATAPRPWLGWAIGVTV